MVLLGDCLLELLRFSAVFLFKQFCQDGLSVLFLGRPFPYQALRMGGCGPRIDC